MKIKFPSTKNKKKTSLFLWNTFYFGKKSTHDKRDKRNCFDSSTKTDSAQRNSPSRLLLVCGFTCVRWCWFRYCCFALQHNCSVREKSNNLWMFHELNWCAQHERRENNGENVQCSTWVYIAYERVAVEPLTQSTKCNWRKKLRPRNWKTRQLMPRASFSLKNYEAEQFIQLELELLSLSSEISLISLGVSIGLKANLVDHNSHVVAGVWASQLLMHPLLDENKQFFSQPCESEMANMRYDKTSSQCRCKCEKC